MNEKQRTRTSKFLSLVLRHEPERIGLTLDPSGWVEVDALLAGCRKHGVAIERAELEEIVSTNEKRRFAFSDDGRRIRASQGHSVDVSLGYVPETPPPQLFHGTATRFLESIRAGGLRKGERHHVHLSADVETAQAVGQRHGKPVVLTVNAEEMLARGHRFFVSENGVWLTEHVPVDFIVFPAAASETKAGVGKRSTRSNLAKETIAICEAGYYSVLSGNRVQIDAALREAIAGTKLHELEGELEHRGSPVTPTKLDVTDETTIAALRRLQAVPGGHLACLNFASAKNPGGGFLGGSEAQEESLARSSGLYPCLLAAPAYYERHRSCRSALYLDLAIWAPSVPFFRDENGALLGQPFLASVLTSPAPNAGAVAANEPARLDEVESTLRRRAAFVLALAARHGVRRLVLGAWGCGVFRNDPRVVAGTFRDLLGGTGPFSQIFEEVVFAIYDRSAGQPVLRSFQAAFA